MTIITRSKAKLLKNSNADLEIDKSTLLNSIPSLTSLDFIKLKPLLQLLSCPRCSNLLVDPTTLTCGHTICKKCINTNLVPTVCPLVGCSKPHYNEEIKVNIVILKLLHLLQQQSDSLLLLLTPTCTIEKNGKTDEDDAGNDESILPELECQLCLNLLYQPFTTPCGHTLCKSCLTRSLDYSDKCPTCRCKLPSHQFLHSAPTNLLLTQFISNLYPKFNQQRSQSIITELNSYSDEVPLFVCSLIFPKMPCYLHVFEAKYRLMVRRCIEMNKPRFGMVLHASNSIGFHQYGTMVELRSVETLQDGRFLMDGVGTYRFRIEERGVRDGYNVARIERIDDIDIGFSQQSSCTGAPTLTELYEECKSFVDALQACSSPQLFRRLNSTVGSMPQDPSDFSFWIASIIPLDEQEKFKLISVTSAYQRLLLIRQWILKLKEVWQFDRMCQVM